MLHRISLLDELRKGGYEASLIATFNAYLPFYEEVVLRRLVNAGVRQNVVLMDAQQYVVSMETHPPRLAGRHYTLVPAKIAGAFHPKLIFLAGKKKGLIAIGSHNLTLAGFGFNRELTNVVVIERDDDLDGIVFAKEVWSSVEHWLKDHCRTTPGQVLEFISRVRDRAPWLKEHTETRSSITLLAGGPGRPTLWDQLRSLQTDEVAEIFVSGAFFDRKSEFLRRLTSELNPDRVIVAVDPDSVDIAHDAQTIPGITFVNARTLGNVESEEQATGGYLHAKGLLIRQRNDQVLLVTGSANPSTPAWTASEARGNVEMMLVRFGADAAQAAELIGFTRIPSLPALEATDWHKIQFAQTLRVQSGSTGVERGLALLDGSRFIFARALLQGNAINRLDVCDARGQQLASTTRLERSGDKVTAEFPEVELHVALELLGYVDSELRLRLLVHHAREIEEQARTGIQRKFKDALLSLETDSPNIALLIDCIDKIVFADDVSTAQTMLRKSTQKPDTKSAEVPAPESLAIDVTDVKKRRSKHRLQHSGDFAYLLDALIYHLRIQEDREIEELDHFGRSEEEQIGADDEEDQEERKIAVQNADILRLCHSKVRTLINRMATQLNAYLARKQPLDKVLTRLLGVLAVLRELRRCDSSAPWVKQGETAVPREQRVRLLDEVMFSLFEGKQSILNLEALGEDFEHSDDIARLKGLLLLLAWDCGLTLNLRTPFMESRAELNERLRQNAMVLALAQMIRADEVVLDEARSSIGSLSKSELEWLLEIQRLASTCDAVQQTARHDFSVSETVPGDIATHRTLKGFGLRVVGSSGGNLISLIHLSKGKDHIDYRPEFLRIVRMPAGRSQQ